VPHSRYPRIDRWLPALKAWLDTHPGDGRRRVVARLMDWLVTEREETSRARRRDVTEDRMRALLERLPHVPNKWTRAAELADALEVELRRRVPDEDWFEKYLPPKHPPVEKIDPLRLAAHVLRGGGFSQGEIAELIDDRDHADDRASGSMNARRGRVRDRLRR
jgi:hypothetical protein